MTALAEIRPRSGGLDYLKDFFHPADSDTEALAQAAYADAKATLYGCRRSPLRYQLRRQDGHTAALRCKSPNKCAECARRAAVENAEMIAVDARSSGAPPALWVVLTTRNPSWDQRYKSRDALLRAIKRRYPAAEVATVTEFQTGIGDGQRRPHWNLLLKNVPVEAADFVRSKVESVWCGREDAEPWCQHVTEITRAETLALYLSAHFYKECQQPPAGWTGHRFTCSRGYFGDQTRAEARASARLSLRHRARLFFGESVGMLRDEAEDWATAAAVEDSADTWTIEKLDAVSVMQRNDAVLARVAADHPARYRRRPRARVRGEKLTVRKTLKSSVRCGRLTSQQAPPGTHAPSFHNINYRALWIQGVSSVNAGVGRHVAEPGNSRGRESESSR